MSRSRQSPEEKRAINAWRVMKRRCLEPGFRDYPRYGGAGIKICPHWLASFDQFLADMGLPPSPTHWLGRKNVLGNFEPENCLWTTSEEHKRRRTFCTKYKLNCRELTLTEAARELLIPPRRLWTRVKQYGQSFTEAVQPGPVIHRNEIILTHVGVTLPLREWSKKTGTPRALLARRLKAGWPPDQALHPRR